MRFCDRQRRSDLAIVEGRFDQAAWERCGQVETTTETSGGGSLDALCEWLDLPRVAVVDVRLLANCHIPRRPVADGLLLDRVKDRADFCRWQTNLESLWGVPVIGGLGECACAAEQSSWVNRRQ